MKNCLLKYYKFAMSKCKSEWYLVLMLRTSELDLNNSLFLTTNNNKENIYWEWRGKTTKFLSTSQQETLLLQPVISIFILFWILNILVIWEESMLITPAPQDEYYAIWYKWVNIWKIRHPSYF